MIIKNFIPLSGKHCITNSIRQIFKYNGIDISEAMILGLGSGINWFYMEHKASPSPMISGRKKPLDFERAFARNTGITIKFNKTSSTKKAYKGMADLIKSGHPVMLYVDMPYLKYLNMPESLHFGGHSVVVFGIEENKNIAYVSDRDGGKNPLNVRGKILANDYYIVPMEELARARNSKYGPFPAENKWLEFDFKNFKDTTAEMIKKSLLTNVTEMLHPPIKNMGIEGIEKFAKSVMGWKEFDGDRLKNTGLYSFFMINEKGGTGGGAFRNLFAHFLEESALITKNKQLDRLSSDYLNISDKWDAVGDNLWKLNETGDKNILDEISHRLKEIAEKEAQALTKLHNILT